MVWLDAYEPLIFSNNWCSLLFHRNLFPLALLGDLIRGPQGQTYSKDRDSSPSRERSHAGFCIQIPLLLSPIGGWNFLLWFRGTLLDLVPWHDKKKVAMWRERCVWAGILNACPRLVTAVNWVLWMGKLKSGVPSLSPDREPETKWTPSGAFCHFLSLSGFLPSCFSAKHSILEKLMNPREVAACC